MKNNSIQSKEKKESLESKLISSKMIYCIKLKDLILFVKAKDCQGQIKML